VYPSVGDQPEFIGGERDSSPDKRRRGEATMRRTSLVSGVAASRTWRRQVAWSRTVHRAALATGQCARASHGCPCRGQWPPGHPSPRELGCHVADAPLQHQLGALGDGSHCPGRRYSPLPLESSVRPAPDEIRAGLMTVAPS